ncbi:MAG TPA: hypothetical protein ENN80_11555, partial [Candidatus Hydrogenedentes bacterium]|nr:hypothetical protein [Candidatus Hydrogenedentota bacterium]
MRSRAACFDELRAYCEQTPIVDCHDHSGECGPKHTDPILAVITGYFPSDLQSASTDQVLSIIHDPARPLEERWPALEQAWKRTCHTGYAQVTRRVLQHFYGEDDLTLDALHRITDSLPNLQDEARFEAVLDEAR